ncbi:ClpX C4-type zinc finger protein [Sorangium sp. So ce887]|uniref:ClpX C4-type zinc finger protein n=1 Tax=Sorangium sp. So ce887 TaxID=3133324 RepID=UPI003F632B2B
MTLNDEITEVEGEADAPRSCSFCGDTESKLVAGPEANICAACTRLACGVLGIKLSSSDTE